VPLSIPETAGQGLKNVWKVLKSAEFVLFFSSCIFALLRWHLLFSNEWQLLLLVWSGLVFMRVEVSVV